MEIIGSRIIEVLKLDSTLTTLLGGARNIFARSLQEVDNRPPKYVCVETSYGADLNYTNGQDDEIDIEIGVSRKITNSFSIIMSIIERVNYLLNKQEVNLSNSSWKILNFVLSDSPTKGVLVDSETNEYYFLLRYIYLLDEN